MKKNQNRELFFYSGKNANEFREQIAIRYGALNEQKLYNKAILGNRGLDILVTKPCPDCPCINLITMGAAATITMFRTEFTEFVITLPALWPMDFKAWEDDRYYWPIRLIQDAASFTYRQGVQLDWFHTLDNGKPYAHNTQLSACLFTLPERCLSTVFADGTAVKFLQIVPLYPYELEYCCQGGTADLCSTIFRYYPRECFAEIDPCRPSFL